MTFKCFSRSKETTGRQGESVDINWKLRRLKTLKFHSINELGAFQFEIRIEKIEYVARMKKIGKACIRKIRIFSCENCQDILPVVCQETCETGGAIMEF